MAAVVAALERSFIEICGFEREALHRFRDVTVNLGKVPHRPLNVLLFFFEFPKFVSTRGLNAITCQLRLAKIARRADTLAV